MKIHAISGVCQEWQTYSRFNAGRSQSKLSLRDTHESYQRGDEAMNYMLFTLIFLHST